MIRSFILRLFAAPPLRVALERAHQAEEEARELALRVHALHDTAARAEAQVELLTSRIEAFESEDTAAADDRAMGERLAPRLSDAAEEAFCRAADLDFERDRVGRLAADLNAAEVALNQARNDAQVLKLELEIERRRARDLEIERDGAARTAGAHLGRIKVLEAEVASLRRERREEATS